MVKVLIVDDEFIMRQGLKYMISWEEEGYELIGEASNGKEALEMIEINTPQIVISDIVMPQIDGVDFTEVVHRRWPQIRIIILSGYDKFEFVRRTMINGAVDYILKPTLDRKTLLDVLDKAVRQIPGFVRDTEKNAVSLERLLERSLMGHKETFPGVEMEEALKGPVYRVFAVNVKAACEKGEDQSGVLISRIERTMNSEKVIPWRMLILQGELVMIIMGYRQSERARIMHLAQELSSQLAVFCPRIFCVLSSPFEEPSELQKIYSQEVLVSTNMAFYYSEKNLLDISKEGISGSERGTVRFDFLRYGQMLSSRNYREVIQMVDHFGREALERRAEESFLKSQIKNMVYQFLDHLQIDDDLREESQFSLFAQISGAASEKEMQQVLDRIYLTLGELYGEAAPSADHRIEKMLEYISDHYKEDLRLEDLADTFSFNYYYLSSYFNQQMKEGFSEYLTRIRIEQACRLLSETDKPISWIGGEIGYLDQSYFSRVFKKQTGRTPSSWRRSQKMNDKEPPKD